jgi:hypothetical protein
MQIYGRGGIALASPCTVRERGGGGLEYVKYKIRSEEEENKRKIGRRERERQGSKEKERLAEH